ncbi:hypothetical protein HN51_028141 [Arachis hypogaea]
MPFSGSHPFTADENLGCTSHLQRQRRLHLSLSPSMAMEKSVLPLTFNADEDLPYYSCELREQLAAKKCRRATSTFQFLLTNYRRSPSSSRLHGTTPSTVGIEDFLIF